MVHEMSTRSEGDRKLYLRLYIEATQEGAKLGYTGEQTGEGYLRKVCSDPKATTEDKRKARELYEGLAEKDAPPWSFPPEKLKATKVKELHVEATLEVQEPEVVTPAQVEPPVVEKETVFIGYPSTDMGSTTMSSDQWAAPVPSPTVSIATGASCGGFTPDTTQTIFAGGPDDPARTQTGLAFMNKGIDEAQPTPEDADPFSFDAMLAPDADVEFITKPEPVEYKFFSAPLTNPPSIDPDDPCPEIYDHTWALLQPDSAFYAHQKAFQVAKGSALPYLEKMTYDGQDYLIVGVFSGILTKSKRIGQRLNAGIRVKLPGESDELEKLLHLPEGMVLRKASNVEHPAMMDDSGLSREIWCLGYLPGLKIRTWISQDGKDLDCYKKYYVLTPKGKVEINSSEYNKA